MLHRRGNLFQTFSRHRTNLTREETRRRSTFFRLSGQEKTSRVTSRSTLLALLEYIYPEYQQIACAQGTVGLSILTSLVASTHRARTTRRLSGCIQAQPKS
ncbi:hypothetical protein RSAG8_07558, partial [Rhizoctonia solani AG-8 WAC10335]